MHLDSQYFLFLGLHIGLLLQFLWPQALSHLAFISKIAHFLPESLKDNLLILLTGRCMLVKQNDTRLHSPKQLFSKNLYYSKTAFQNRWYNDNFFWLPNLISLKLLIFVLSDSDLLCFRKRNEETAMLTGTSVRSRLQRLCKWIPNCSNTWIIVYSPIPRYNGQRFWEPRSYIFSDIITMFNVRVNY